MFIGLLSSIENASYHTKCESLSNQKCMTQPTLMSTVKNYSFTVNPDRCTGSYNTIDDLPI